MDLTKIEKYYNTQNNMLMHTRIKYLLNTHINRLSKNQRNESRNGQGSNCRCLVRICEVAIHRTLMGVALKNPHS